MKNKQQEAIKIKQYFRAKELAEHFSIGLSTVWLYAKQGKLHPKKLSERVTLFDINEATKLFDSSSSYYE